MWHEKARRFDQMWNFPHAIGAIDGKHVAIEAPIGSGSMFYNYKGYSSIVLFAAVDADLRFTFVDIGTNGRDSDACSKRDFSLARVRSQRREPKGLDFLTSCVAKGRSRDSAIVSHHRPLKHLKSAGKSETEADNLTNVTWQWSGQVV
ncbi:unnamed protein product [Nesidiocoris tenuis]|uniref:DDE Tnp4 domain-containing protein n=1 Tax=Nesidiocoris tenuis TaxID=355587 RepID=A0A6H5GBM8_9HEMI|nr:unnamed protein product [Nesidiocoris tenuis]